LPAYASLVRYGDPALVARNAAAACARGYQAIKLHELGVAHVQAAREAIGPDIGLMLDVNCPWSVAEALEMAKQFRRFELSWFEEPVWPPEDFAGLAEVRRQAGMPVSAGENVTSVKQFEHMFAASALDIAQPSVTKIGGITEFMSVLALAGKYGVPVVPHSPYFGPGLLASLQIAATLPAVTMIEYSFMDLEANPLGDAISVHDGTIRIPTGPGLGRDPDLEIVERYRLP
jgi:L-alanine-DL-glutamate epimerase-like enolase superfamily enzyme